MERRLVLRLLLRRPLPRLIPVLVLLWVLKLVELLLDLSEPLSRVLLPEILWTFVLKAFMTFLSDVSGLLFRSAEVLKI